MYSDRGLRRIPSKQNYMYKYKVNCGMQQRPLRNSVMLECVMNKGECRREAGKVNRVQMFGLCPPDNNKFSLF